MALNYTPINPPTQTSISDTSTSDYVPPTYEQYSPSTQADLDSIENPEDEVAGYGVIDPTASSRAQNIAKQSSANAATNTGISSGKITQVQETQLDPSSLLTFCPDDMPFGAGKTNNWAPVINGIQINRVQYKISEPTAGMRVDILPQLQFHYPMLRAQGYELTQFTLDLFAWDQDSFNELQQILNSVIPPVFPFGNKKQPPKVSNISYPPLDARQLNKFIPIKPSTSFLAWDQDQMGIPCKFTFLQWIPASFTWKDPVLLDAQPLPGGTGQRPGGEGPGSGNSNSAANFIQE